MGYTTDFNGRFKLDRPLTDAHREYLTKFCETRRMKRDEGITAKRPDPVREAVGLPVGIEGEYFVGEGGCAGQCDDDEQQALKEKFVAQGMDWGRAYRAARVHIGILDYNGAPRTQHGLWCKWIPTECGNYIEWSGAEKFYDYVEWLQYICDNFLSVWGYTLNGEIAFQGEARDDNGKFYCVANRVTRNASPLVHLASAAIDWEQSDPGALDNPYCYDEE